jgi:hypothetical protein
MNVGLPVGLSTGDGVVSPACFACSVLTVTGWHPNSLVFFGYVGAAHVGKTTSRWCLMFCVLFSGCVDMVCNPFSFLCCQARPRTVGCQLHGMHLASRGSSKRADSGARRYAWFNQPAGCYTALNMWHVQFNQQAHQAGDPDLLYLQDPSTGRVS